MGKSALALKSAVETAKRGRHAFFFSLEMPRAELSTRIASLVSRTKHDAIDAEAPGPDVFSALAKVQNEIGSKPLSIVDRHGMSPSRIRSVARQAFASGERNGFPRGLIVVDYLQLMHAEVERGANRERQVSSCSAAMKEIAKELHVPVMVLSQINRGVEDRSVKDKRPQMSDLRESGAIEQDADVIMFPFRPAKYDESLRAETEDAELIFAKFRGGKEGTVKIMWRGSNMEFLTVEHETEDQLDDLDYAITDPYGGSYS